MNSTELKRKKMMWERIIKGRCKSHSKHTVLWSDPCVREYFEGKFWKRLGKVIHLLLIEIDVFSRGKVKVLQAKEKWGATCLYYCYASNNLKLVPEGKVRQHLAWIAKDEGLMDFNFSDLKTKEELLTKKAEKLLKPYLGKKLPKTKRVLHNIIKNREGEVDRMIPFPVKRALERQRRLNPDLAHYIYDFSPQECDCTFEFLCEKYTNVPLYRRILDRIIVIFLLAIKKYYNFKIGLKYKWWDIKQFIIPRIKEWKD